MGLFILISGLTIEFIGALFLSRNDVMRPSVIVSGVMLMGGIFANYLLQGSWKGIVFHEDTALIILFAILIYIIVEELIYHVLPHKGRQVALREIEVSTIKVLVIIIIDMVVLMLHFRFVMSSTSLSSLAALSYYRQIRLYTNETHMPSYLSYGRRVVSLSAYILLYVFINNFICGKKNIKNFFLLLPVLLSALDEFLEGGRMEIVRIITFAISLSYILYQRKKGWKYKFKFKQILKFAGCAVLFMMGFTYLGNILGRESSSNGVINNIAIYAGGGTVLFDLFLHESKIVSPFPGYLTFAKMYADIARRFHVESLNYIPDMEFRSFRGINLGNCYTVLRPYIQDFGYVGAMIFVAVFSAFFIIYYSKVKRKKPRHTFDFSLLFYCYMFLGPCLFGFDEYFLFDFLTLGTVTLLIEFWAVKWILIDFRVRMKKYRNYLTE